jgi:amino-acid N-acetyltransferase
LVVALEMSNLQIFAARPEDWSDVKALLSNCDLPHEDLTPAHLTLFRIVRQDAALVAVAGLEGFAPSGLLRSLAVAPSYRGRGLGTRLVGAMESMAAENGLTQLYLLTLTAPAFFAKHDYRRIDRSQAPGAIQTTAEFTSLCPASAILMYKRLA